jgi:hypothetical protein
MPKTSGGWYNSVIAGDFLVQILETRIHKFLGKTCGWRNPAEPELTPGG